MEKDDRQFDWVLWWKTDSDPVDDDLIAAARAAWPRVLAHARRTISAKEFGGEIEALAAEIWEAVLKSVSSALHRKRAREAPVADLQGYLFAAFHHRLNRFLKAEKKRRENMEVISSAEDLDRIAGARNTSWAGDVERAIIVREIISHMDPWTKGVWEARQSGYSWKEISHRLVTTEQKAKMKFQYGLEQTRKKLLKKRP